MNVVPRCVLCDGPLTCELCERCAAHCVADGCPNSYAVCGLYILDGKRPVPSANVAQWQAFMFGDIERRRVSATDVGIFTVFTTFLAIDTDAPLDPQTREPKMFETMIKRRNPPHYLNLQKRYATWEQAEAGHASVVLFVRNNYDRMAARGDVTANQCEDN